MAVSDIGKFQEAYQKAKQTGQVNKLISFTSSKKKSSNKDLIKRTEGKTVEQAREILEEERKKRGEDQNAPGYQVTITPLTDQQFKKGKPRPVKLTKQEYSVEKVKENISSSGAEKAANMVGLTYNAGEKYAPPKVEDQKKSYTVQRISRQQIERENRLDALIKREERAKQFGEILIERFGLGEDKNAIKDQIKAIGRNTIRGGVGFTLAAGRSLTVVPELLSYKEGRKELIESVGLVPSSIKEGFNYRTSEGRVNLAFAALAVYGLGSSRMAEARGGKPIKSVFEESFTERFFDDSTLSDTTKSTGVYKQGKRSVKFSGESSQFVQRTGDESFVLEGKANIKTTQPKSESSVQTRGLGKITGDILEVETLGKVTSGKNTNYRYDLISSRQIADDPFVLETLQRGGKLPSDKIVSIENLKPDIVSGSKVVELVRKPVITESGDLLGTRQILATRRSGLALRDVEPAVRIERSRANTNINRVSKTVTRTGLKDFPVDLATQAAMKNQAANIFQIANLKSISAGKAATSTGLGLLSNQIGLTRQATSIKQDQVLGRLPSPKSITVRATRQNAASKSLSRIGTSPISKTGTTSLSKVLTDQSSAYSLTQLSKVASATKQDYRLSQSLAPVTTGPFSFSPNAGGGKFLPPFGMDLPNLGGGISKSRKTSKTKQKKKYRPDLRSTFFNIKGPRPTKLIAPFQSRPL